jgi:hypothetical protein
MREETKNESVCLTEILSNEKFQKKIKKSVDYTFIGLRQYYYSFAIMVDDFNIFKDAG